MLRPASPGTLKSPASRLSVLDKPHAIRRRLRLHGTIAQELGTLIVSGRLEPGGLLDNEIEASDRLKVSRTAYREAVRILAAKGLVEARPKVGTRVSPVHHWHLLDPDVLAWIFAGEPDPELITALFELRRIVEPQAAALAAARRTPADLKVMERALEAMVTYSLAHEAGRAGDQEFHAALLSASGNPFLESLTGGIAAAVARTTIFKQRHQPLARDPVPDHMSVYEAIKNRKPKRAQQAMARLIDLALRDTTQARAAKHLKRARAPRLLTRALC
jgi:DNA-binding FadR family transcriptional regulator